MDQNGKYPHDETNEYDPTEGPLNDIVVDTTESIASGGRTCSFDPLRCSSEGRRSQAVRPCSPCPVVIRALPSGEKTARDSGLRHIPTARRDGRTRSKIESGSPTCLRVRPMPRSVSRTRTSKPEAMMNGWWGDPCKLVTPGHGNSTSTAPCATFQQEMVSSNLEAVIRVASELAQATRKIACLDVVSLYRSVQPVDSQISK